MPAAMSEARPNGEGAEAPDHEVREAPTLGALFLGFFLMGMCGFGGVLPWARWMIVERRQWLTAAEFTDMLALCQFLPGPNITNMSIVLGSRFHGVAGSASCLGGLMIAPVCIVLLMGDIYARYADIPAVGRGFAGLAAAASALILVMAIKIAAPLRGNWPGIAVAALVFGLIAVLRLPLLPVLVGVVPAGIALSWWLGRRPRA
jgi:chromate transporter